MMRRCVCIGLWLVLVLCAGSAMAVLPPCRTSDYPASYSIKAKYAMCGHWNTLGANGQCQRAKDKAQAESKKERNLLKKRCKALAQGKEDCLDAVDKAYEKASAVNQLKLGQCRSR